MEELFEFLREALTQRRAEWLLVLLLVTLACVFLHPRVLRARTWGARAARPSPPSDERSRSGYRRRSR